MELDLKDVVEKIVSLIEDDRQKPDSYKVYIEAYPYEYCAGSDYSDNEECRVISLLEMDEGDTVEIRDPSGMIRATVNYRVTLLKKVDVGTHIVGLLRIEKWGGTDDMNPRDYYKVFYEVAIERKPDFDEKKRREFEDKLRKRIGTALENSG